MDVKGHDSSWLPFPSSAHLDELRVRLILLYLWAWDIPGLGLVDPSFSTLIFFFLPFSFFLLWFDFTVICFLDDTNPRCSLIVSQVPPHPPTCQLTGWCDCAHSVCSLGILLLTGDSTLELIFRTILNLIIPAHKGKISTDYDLEGLVFVQTQDGHFSSLLQFLWDEI